MVYRSGQCSLPWRIYQIAAEALIVSLTVEMVFVVFMVESFHRLSPISPLLNAPQGWPQLLLLPLGLLLIVIPSAWPARCVDRAAIGSWATRAVARRAITPV
jgi:hypothetical protein